MRKPWLLIVAGIILLILIGLWLYLFFGGDDAREDLYNAFGLQGDELPFGIEDIFGNDSATTSVPYLRQLSFRQVIGYVPFSTSSTSNPYVYFAEAGTGHVYKVDAVTGNEERLSNITIPTATRAVFSPNGQYVAVVPNDSRTITVVTLPNGTSTVTSATIETRVADISFTTENVLVYTERNSLNTVGFSYNPTNEERATIFTIPFREAVVAFGETVNGPHYTYPKPAEELEGYVYEVSSDVFRRLPISGFGLSMQASATWIVYAKIENNQPKTFLFNKTNGDLSALDIPLYPEKCASHVETFVCGVTSESQTLSSWYQGEATLNDSLWYFVPEVNYSFFIEDISAIANTSIDMLYPRVRSGALYFINKTTNSLWVYDRDFTSPVIDN